jgi:predicted NAD/FAD-binding protein
MLDNNRRVLVFLNTSMKTVAVIGAGISGLAAAYFLSRRHRVHVFEKESRLGGHTNTVVVEGANGAVALDTGFLVYNDRTYPNLVRLFGELGVATRDSDMSFAVSCRRSGLEYSSRGANGFFAQRRNLVRPSHLALLGEIVRFNREAPALLTAPDAERQTLGDFLESRRFGEGFTHRYLFPWRRRFGRRHSTRSDRFPRSRSFASSTTMDCSRSTRSRRGRSWPAGATSTCPRSWRACPETST